MKARRRQSGQQRRSNDRSVRDIITAARQLLEFAQVGHQDYAEGGGRRPSGMYSAITSGEAAYAALKGLKRKVDGYDEWAAAAEERLGPVGSWFTDVRDAISHEGTVGDASVRIGSFASGEVPIAPPGATMFFVGDRLGRSGWIITLPDGSDQYVYCSLPAGIGPVDLVLPDAPDGRSLSDLLPEYLRLMAEVIDDAEVRFLGTEEGKARTGLG